jgi:glycerophosphoryl diester phosphodiesterase
MQIYAHRGASGDFPEGSKAAYMGAIEQGADGFECDVRLTKDKQIICYHDKDAKRLANLDLEIAKSAYSELKKSIDPFRLDELLELAILNKKDLVIEFKHPVPTSGEVEKQVHMLLASKRDEIAKSEIEILLISFSFLATLRNKRSPHKSGYLMKNKFLARFNPTQFTLAHIEIIKSDHSFVKNEKKKGRQVIAWTVNELSDLKLCQDLEVYAVITDYPARARKHLGYS